MGCCVTTQSQDNAGQRFENEAHTKSIKILLLGTANSGKTTIIKQLQKICDVYNEDTYCNMSQYIKDSIVINMKILCAESVHDNLENFRNDVLALQPPFNLTADIMYKIKALYLDHGIQKRLKVLRKTDCFQICDNIDYFINKIDEIASDEYIADFEDSVRIYRRTIGYSAIKLLRFVDVFGEYMFEIPDVGGSRSERKKWRNPKLLLHPDLNTIIYVVAISEYNMNYLEDIDNDNTTTNRLIESINAFKQILESINGFNNKTIILLFNKYDLFREKIKKIPINTVTFNNFPKNMMRNDPDHVIRYISGQFLHVFQEFDIALNKPLHIIRTIGIDTDSINIMFNKITSGIVTNFEQNIRNMDNNGVGNDFVHPLMLPQNQCSLPIDAMKLMDQDRIEKQLKLQLAQSLPVHANSKNQ